MQTVSLSSWPQLLPRSPGWNTLLLWTNVSPAVTPKEWHQLFMWTMVVTGCYYKYLLPAVTVNSCQQQLLWTPVTTSCHNLVPTAVTINCYHSCCHQLLWTTIAAAISMKNGFQKLKIWTTLHKLSLPAIVALCKQRLPAVHVNCCHQLFVWPADTAATMNNCPQCCHHQQLVQLL